jgi:7-cyano-7-deazaguanine synthase
MDARFVIHTPLMWLGKKNTWRLADKLGGQQLVDLIIEATHTCYHGDREHKHDWGWGCGDCPACDIRAKGWKAFTGERTI